MKTPPLNAGLPNVDDGGTARLLPDEDSGASYVGAMNNTADEDEAKPNFRSGTLQLFAAMHQ